MRCAFFVFILRFYYNRVRTESALNYSLFIIHLNFPSFNENGGFDSL